jgi:hypothetical protein
LLEPISPKSHRDKVQKPSKESRHLENLCLINVDEIKETSDLAEASDFLVESMDTSDPWQSLGPLELLEKFECHAEALLTNPIFVNALEGWPGLQELKSFTGKKWWKHCRQALHRYSRRLEQQTSPQSSTEAQSTDAMSFDFSHDGSNVDTPTVDTDNKRGKKGMSSLRPRLSSVSQAPVIPTRFNRSDLDVLFDANPSFSDDEVQIIEAPKDLSLKVKSTNKRRLDEHPHANSSKRPRNGQTEAVSENPAKSPFISFKFGRGRPPMTTVPVDPSFSLLSDR